MVAIPRPELPRVPGNKGSCANVPVNVPLLRLPLSLSSPRLVVITPPLASNWPTKDSGRADSSNPANSNTYGPVRIDRIAAAGNADRRRHAKGDLIDILDAIGNVALPIRNETAYTRERIEGVAVKNLTIGNEGVSTIQVGERVIAGGRRRLDI